MNLKKNDPQKISNAVAGIESWLETISNPRGYCGPVVAREAVSMRYCGPGFDWRYEGLLDAQATLFKSSADERYLDRMESDLEAICSAQLCDGSFRNSYFEFNPCEGGMPYEPAMLAATCRAAIVLRDAGRALPADLENVLDRFVERRLVRNLWSRLLRTFNDWMQSDFKFYSAASVATCIEMLAECSRLGVEVDGLNEYIEQAADSLLLLQIEKGAALGGVPISNREDAPATVWSTARALVGLDWAARNTGSEKYQTGLEKGLQFIGSRLSAERATGSYLSGENHSARRALIFGELANSLNAVGRIGRLKDLDLDHWLSLILDEQRPSGAFKTASGFGSRAGTLDWRDCLPVCGWIAQIYAYLARFHSGTLGSFSAQPWSTDVMVAGQRAVFEESERSFLLRDSKNKQIYFWEKGASWAKRCDL